jgi:hypothetical protein
MNVKPILFVDVDDTIIARPRAVHSGFELRPCLNLLRRLSEDFDCRWMTCVGDDTLERLKHDLYAGVMLKDFTYEHWNHADGKAATVTQYRDWWWLEDWIGTAEAGLLRTVGKYDRYVKVKPWGLWSFHEAIVELYRRMGKTPPIEASWRE